MARRGYWGDIVNSPFISLGIESKNRDLFKTANDKHVKVRVRCVFQAGNYVYTYFLLLVEQCSSV